MSVGDAGPLCLLVQLTRSCAGGNVLTPRRPNLPGGSPSGSFPLQLRGAASNAIRAGDGLLNSSLGSSSPPFAALSKATALALSIAKRATALTTEPTSRQSFISPLRLRLPVTQHNHEAVFHMRKLSSHQEQELFDAGTYPTDADSVVEDAAKCAAALWQKTHAGMGDTQEAAMYRAAAKYGVEPGTFWALRYRRPKAILAHIYLRLKAAYEAECGRQEARLRHELELTKALPATPARLALVAETEAFLGKAQRPEETVTGGTIVRKAAAE